MGLVQAEYVRGISKTITAPAARGDEEIMTTEELSAFGSLTNTLAWPASITRADAAFDVSKLQQAIRNAQIDENIAL